MRLARIAHPEGVAFVSVDGAEGAERVREIEDHPFGDPTYTGRSWPLADTRLLAPILPSKVVAIGRNYADHAAELGNAVPTSPRVDYEGELAVVIGRPCRDVLAENASSVILGYTIGNDVTARDQQRADVQFTRGKGYDTFCPLGP